MNMDYFCNREKSNKVITFFNPKEREYQIFTVDINVLFAMLTTWEDTHSPERI